MRLPQETIQSISKEFGPEYAEGFANEVASLKYLGIKSLSIAGATSFSKPRIDVEVVCLIPIAKKKD